MGSSCFLSTSAKRSLLQLLSLSMSRGVLGLLPPLPLLLLLAAAPAATAAAPAPVSGAVSIMDRGLHEEEDAGGLAPESPRRLPRRTTKNPATIEPRTQ